MAKYATDDLEDKVGHKYLLACAVSKRAKVLNLMQEKDELASNIKTINYAANELMEDKIKIVNE